MTLDAFKSLPDEAPVWIYAFATPLKPADVRLVNNHLSAFMLQWHSHNVGVEGDFEIIDDRFVFICVTSRESVSGCSIDSSVNNFKKFRDEHGLDALDRNLVHYRDDEGAIQAVSRSDFKGLVADGKCGPDTAVFDLTLETLGAVREGRFEVTLRDAWHAEAFLPA